MLFGCEALPTQASAGRLSDRGRKPACRRLGPTGPPFGGPNRKKAHLHCRYNSDDFTSSGSGTGKQYGISGELSGRVGLSQLPAPGPELVAICKGLLPLPI